MELFRDIAATWYQIKSFTMLRVYSLLAALDPDGNITTMRKGGYFSSISSNENINSGESYQTSILDKNGYDYFYYELESDVEMLLTFEFFDDEEESHLLRTFTIPYNPLEDAFVSRYSSRVTQFLKITVTNTSEDDSTLFHFRFGVTDNPPAAPLIGITGNVAPNARAQLTRSVLVGVDQDGNYKNVGINEVGAAQVSNFLLDVARGKYQGYSIDVKFGRNNDIDTGGGSNQESVWNGGGVYTGFPNVSDNVEIRSDSTGDTTANGSFTYSPDSIVELAAWYRASDGVIESGGTISSWEDQSGNGFDLTGEDSPQYTSSDLTLNNQPTVDLGSNSSWFSLGSGLAEFYNGASAVTVVVLAKRNSFNTIDPMFDIGANNSDSKFYAEISANDAVLSGGRSNANDGFQQAQGGGNFINDDWFLFEFNMDLAADTITNYRDNSQISNATGLTFDSTTFGTDSGINNAIGAYLDGTVKGDFDIAEVVFYTKNLNQSERDSLVFYYNDRYNLSIPYVNGNPEGTDGAGARTVRVIGLDNDFNTISENVSLKGTTWVELNNSYRRLSRAFVLTAGSSLTNIGEITIRQSTDTDNIFAVMPVGGQTDIAADTVPAGKTRFILSLRCSMVRSNGAAGSAIVSFRAKPAENNGAWRARRRISISNGSNYNETLKGALVLPEKTDMEWFVEQVSDNNTRVAGEWEYVDIDNEFLT